MNVLATMGIIIAVLLLVLIAVIKIALNERKQKYAYKSEAERKSNTIDYLYEHFVGIEKIRADGKSVEQELKNAETDEEVLDIINAVVNRNNDRVRKQTEK